MFILGLIIGVIAGFIGGVLFGRRNKDKVEKVIDSAEGQLDKIKK